MDGYKRSILHQIEDRVISHIRELNRKYDLRLNSGFRIQWPKGYKSGQLNTINITTYSGKEKKVVVIGEIRLFVPEDFRINMSDIEVELFDPPQEMNVAKENVSTNQIPRSTSVLGSLGELCRGIAEALETVDLSYLYPQFPQGTGNFPFAFSPSSSSSRKIPIRSNGGSSSSAVTTRRNQIRFRTSTQGGDTQTSILYAAPYSTKRHTGDEFIDYAPPWFHQLRDNHGHMDRIKRFIERLRDIFNDLQKRYPSWTPTAIWERITERIYDEGFLLPACAKGRQDNFRLDNSGKCQAAYCSTRHNMEDGRCYFQSLKFQSK